MRADYYLLCLLLLRSSNVDCSEDPRIVILDPDGAGTATLANVLLGCPPSEEECPFEVCDDVNSCSKEPVYKVGNWTGSGDNLTVVNTPSFGDPGLDDYEIMENMMEFFKNEINTTNVFLLSLNGSNDGIDSTSAKIIRKYEVMFGKQFWNNVVIEFTDWQFDAESIEVRNNSGKTENWKIQRINSDLREIFKLTFELPAVFIDSFSQHESNVNDTNQQTAFQQETSKLWNYLTKFPPCEFRSLKNILEELYAVLNAGGAIIKEMQEDMRSMQIDINHNKELISRNEDLIDKNTGTIIRHDKILLSPMLPVGSISAWSGRLLSNSDLPKGWQLCDGSIIMEGPMKNQKTPLLNHEGRFLRGGLEFDEWTYQEHMMPVHQHDFSDPGHKHEDAGHAHACKTVVNFVEAGTPHNRGRHYFSYIETETIAYADIQHSKTGISIGDPTSTTVPLGDEVRPKNMAVQWIIKIY